MFTGPVHLYQTVGADMFVRGNSGSGRGSCKARQVSRMVQSQADVTAVSLRTRHPHRAVCMEALCCQLFTVHMVRAGLPQGVPLPTAFGLGAGMGRVGEGSGHRGP